MDLEKITIEAQVLQKQISFFERTRSICIKFSIDYYRDGNNLMNDFMKLRLEKIRNNLSNLRSELIKVEKVRLDILSKIAPVTIRKVYNPNIKNYESWMN